MTAPAVRRSGPDLCPGVRSVWSAADGGLARVRIPGGRLTADRLRLLAGAAEDLGNGQLELTVRANVQVRGLGAGREQELAARLRAGDLLPSDTHDRVRNILGSPLTGLPGRGDVADLIEALDEGLCDCDALAALPGRFLFALDDGSADVAALGPDVGVLAVGPGVGPGRTGEGAGLGGVGASAGTGGVGGAGESAGGGRVGEDAGTGGAGAGGAGTSGAGAGGAGGNADMGGAGTGGAGVGWDARAGAGGNADMGGASVGWDAGAGAVVGGGAGDLFALLLGGAPVGRWVARGDVVAVLLAAAEAFLQERRAQCSPAWRLAELADGPARVLSRVAETVPLLHSGPDVPDLAAPHRPSGPGVVEVPDGRLTAVRAREIAAMGTDLRVTPWRSIVVAAEIIRASDAEESTGRYASDVVRGGAGRSGAGRSGGAGQ